MIYKYIFTAKILTTKWVYSRLAAFIPLGVILFLSGALLLHATTFKNKIGEYFLLQQNETAKDAQQDEHMKNTDNSLEELQKDRLERRTETVSYRIATDALLNDIKERMSHDEGYAGGALGALGILQVVGLLRKVPGSNGNSSTEALLRETLDKVRLKERHKRESEDDDNYNRKRYKDS